MKSSIFNRQSSIFNLQSSIFNLYLLPAIGCLLAIVVLGYYYFMTTFDNGDRHETAYIYIDDNDTQQSVLAKLKPFASAHALTGLSTMMRHLHYDANIRTGRYAIEPGISTIHVMRRLRNGQQTPVMLTIPEVRTMPQLAARLSTKLMLDSAALAIRLTADTTSIFNIQYSIFNIPCLFVPDTYEVYWNITVDAFLQRMQREHDAFWNKERRQLAHAIGLTPNQVCTLASIIDEETANNAEKPIIAGMYLNRLNKGMPLQADPTVKFAIGDFALKRIYHNHLEVESPYNTYQHVGLPPGPIKIASQKGIDAVLHATRHDYLYMCAKEDFSGTHNFARTYAEHLKNAARYAAALNKRGIK